MLNSLGSGSGHLQTEKVVYRNLPHSLKNQPISACDVSALYAFTNIQLSPLTSLLDDAAPQSRLSPITWKTRPMQLASQ